MIDVGRVKHSNKEIFKINIDPQLAVKLREVINSEIQISASKKQILKINKKEKEYPTWSLVCAIMDRIEDTVDYLNNLELNTGKYTRSAFDFFEFINQATVLVDCIDTLAKIYDVSLDEEDASANIFCQKGKDGKGTDKRYYEYVRSLCSVHPVETSYYSNTYQESDFESSPFVIWADSFDFYESGCNLIARVYINKDDKNDRNIEIRISEIFDFILYRYQLLSKIITAIECYHKHMVDTLIKNPIKDINEFRTYIDYLGNLKLESDERVGSEYSYMFEFVILLLKMHLSNPTNKVRYEKYCSALKYAISFEHKRLQQMSYGSEYSGIVNPEKNLETTLLYELHSVNSRSEDAIKYNYNIQKICNLRFDSSSSDKRWAYQMLEQAKPLFEKYVNFERANGDFENFVLVQIALYFDCLESKCLINKNIPNDLKYRDRLLSDEELSDLLSDDLVDEHIGKGLLELIDDIERRTL